VKSDLLHPDNKPSSIVLTTLVGIAYQMEEELANTFVRISRTLADPIENRDGVFWLSNPVDPRENLVRQWKENDRLRLAFYSWTRQLADDFGDLLELRGLHNVADRLKPTLGTHSVERAFKSIGNELRTLREEQKLFVVGGTGTLSSISGVVVPEHRFHGD
jgi:hypothetical protein